MSYCGVTESAPAPNILQANQHESASCETLHLELKSIGEREQPFEDQRLEVAVHPTIACRKKPAPCRENRVTCWGLRNLVGFL